MRALWSTCRPARTPLVVHSVQCRIIHAVSHGVGRAIEKPSLLLRLIATLIKSTDVRLGALDVTIRSNGTLKMKHFPYQPFGRCTPTRVHCLPHCLRLPPKTRIALRWLSASLGASARARARDARQAMTFVNPIYLYIILRVARRRTGKILDWQRRRRRRRQQRRRPGAEESHKSAD